MNVKAKYEKGKIFVTGELIWLTNSKKFEERKLNFEFLRRNVTSSDFGIYSREYY